MQLLFSKIHTACHNIANGIKPGSSSKKTDEHAANFSKAACLGRKVIYVGCIICSFNNGARGICLFDKAFLCIQEKIPASKSFRKIRQYKIELRYNLNIRTRLTGIVLAGFF